MYKYKILVVCLLEIGQAGQWKVHEEAGEPGWAALVPIYSFIVLLRIVGLQGWWNLSPFIPNVGIIVTFVLLATVSARLAAAFGEGG